MLCHCPHFVAWKQSQIKATLAVPVRLTFPLSVLLVCLLVIVKARSGLYPAGRQANFWRARSRLYRSRLLQVNTKYSSLLHRTTQY